MSRAHGFTVSAKPGGKLGGSVCVSVVGSFLERTAERRFRCVAFGVRMGGGALGLVRISLDGQAGTRGAAERRFSAAKRREAERRSKFPHHKSYTT